MSSEQLNVFGEPLEPCSLEPLTGFYRTGCCESGVDDLGRHMVCMLLTADFLTFSKEHGNDLSTPAPEYGFDGLKPGDRWCLCVDRWIEALQAGRAPWVVLRATHQDVLESIPLNLLMQYSAEARSN